MIRRRRFLMRPWERELLGDDDMEGIGGVRRYKILGVHRN